MSDVTDLKAEVLLLRKENKELRELASIMAYCMQYERDCDGCAMNGAGGAVTEYVGCDELRDALRQLGATA